MHVAVLAKKVVVFRRVYMASTVDLFLHYSTYYFISYANSTNPHIHIQTNSLKLDDNTL